MNGALLTEVQRLWLWAGFRLTALLVAAGLIGLAVGYVGIALLIALGLYTACHLLFAYRLHRWLIHPQVEPGDGIGIWQEIYTALYRLKQRNRRQKRHLKDIVREFQTSTAALPDGILVIDMGGRIVWFNKAAGALLALRAGQDNGQRITNLVRHPRLSDALEHRDARSASIEFPSPVHESVTLSLRVVPYGDQQRLLIVRDISEQKQLESTRRDFVANASHELRTPLTVLRGYLEIMVEESKTQGDLASWATPLHEMDIQSARMERIIEGLLRLAQLESEGVLQPQETIDVAVLIKRHIANIQHSKSLAHHFDMDADPALQLFGRVGGLESVIANLLANAVRYTPTGSTITVRWFRSEHGEPVLTVADNGPGIDSQHLPRLTERFYRVDSSRNAATGGTGLGLAIVKHCLTQHQAQLVITSEPGAGSEFRCIFPPQRAVLGASPSETTLLPRQP